MNSLKKYITVFKLMWKQATDYRFEFIMEIICTFVPIIALSFLWEEIYKGNSTIQGYTIEEMLSYIVLARVVSLIITPNFLFEVMGEIQEGEIQHYICKPISYVKYWFVKSLGSKSRNIIWSLISILVLLLFFFENFTINFTILNLIIFSGMMFLSFTLYFEIIMIISLLSFWFYEISSWYYTLTFVIEFLAGGLFPLVLLPYKVQCICNLLPFKFLIYYPVNIIINGYQLNELIYSLGIVSVWIIIFTVILKVIWNEGIKHYELIGG